MPLLPSLKAEATLLDLFKVYPDSRKPLSELSAFDRNA